MQDAALREFQDRIAERLEQLRQPGETNVALAARLGVSNSALGNYLKARSDIYLSSLLAMAAGGGVTLPWLLGIEADAEAPPVRSDLMAKQVAAVDAAAAAVARAVGSQLADDGKTRSSRGGSRR